MAALNSTGNLQNPGNGRAASVMYCMCVCVVDAFQFLFRRSFLLHVLLLLLQDVYLTMQLRFEDSHIQFLLCLKNSIPFI